MSTLTTFTPLRWSIGNRRTWLISSLFIVGNLLLPQLCHLIPNGGPLFLPIYFFTLIAAYKFGMQAGMLTALLSPLANHLLFGMPAAGMLAVIVIKSFVLAVMAATVAQRSRKNSLLLLAAVVLAYQCVGGLIEGLIVGQLSAGLTDFRVGYPGLLLQVIGGWLVLKALARYGR
jgi:uncharacterized membrane protein